MHPGKPVKEQFVGMLSFENFVSAVSNSAKNNAGHNSQQQIDVLEKEEVEFINRGNKIIVMSCKGQKQFRKKETNEAQYNSQEANQEPSQHNILYEKAKAFNQYQWNGFLS